RTRAVGGVAFCVMIAGFGAHVAGTVAGIAGSPATLVAPALCYLGAIVLLGMRAGTATEDRHGWRALAVAAGFWIAGTAVATLAGRPGGGTALGPADPFWLCFYPLALLAVLLRTRATLDRVVRSVRFDGVIGALSVAAIAWLFVIDPILGNAHARHAATLVNSTYVI